MSNLQDYGIKLPDSYYAQKGITNQEIRASQEYIKQIFSLNSDTPISRDSIYRQLMYALALALRYERCQNAVQYLVNNFQTHVYPN